MKTIVVVAYYHLLHAIETALTMEEKPALVICTDYTKMEDSLVDKISDSGVFHTVIKTDTREFLPSFNEQLKKTKKMSDSEIKAIGTSLFDQYIDAYYYPKFAGLDFEEDVYIYTDYHLIYYSLNKHFRNIIMCEDGYKILGKRYSTYKMRGYFVNLEPFIEAGFYPKMKLGSEKISKIILSGGAEELPPELRNKVEVWDFKEKTERNPAEYNEAVKKIFSTDNIDIRDGAILLIEQPLYRTHFCNNLEYFLFYKKLVGKLAEDHQVIIKPHPAGIKALEIYENENISVIPKWIPAECLNYMDVQFDDIVTFNSAALELLNNTKRHTALYNSEKTDTKSVSRFIRGYIKGEKINIGLYLFYEDYSEKKIFSELSRYYKRNKLFAFRLNIIAASKNQEKANRLISRLEQKHREKVNLFAADRNDQDQIMRIMIDNGDQDDFSIAITGDNKAKDVKKTIKKMCKGSMGHCIGIHQMLGKDVLLYNPLEDHLLTSVVNTLWSKEILRILKAEEISSALHAIQYVYENKISTDSIGMNFLMTADEHRDRLNLFADQCSNEELALVFRVYESILVGLAERQITKPDADNEHTETYNRVLSDVLVDELKLRRKHYAQLQRLGDTKLISLSLWLSDVKKRIRKRLKKTIQ